MEERTDDPSVESEVELETSSIGGPPMELYRDVSELLEEVWSAERVAESDSLLEDLLPGELLSELVLLPRERDG